MNNLVDLEKKINSELGTKINSSEIKHNQIYLEIDSEDLIDVVLFVKTNKDTKFRQLIDITVVDYPERSKRFKIVYLFLSHEFNQRMILSYDISENEVISSLTSIFPSANWMEREVFDMYGVNFKNTSSRVDGGSSGSSFIERDSQRGRERGQKLDGAAICELGNEGPT